MASPRSPAATPIPLTTRKSPPKLLQPPDEKSAMNPRFVVKIRAEWLSRRDSQPGIAELKRLVHELLLMKQNIELLPLNDQDKEKRIIKPADFPATSDILREYFDIAAMPNPNTPYTKVPNMSVVFKINSPISVEQMKLDPVFAEFMRKQKMFIHQHWFKSPKWRVVGFLAQKHTVLFNRQADERRLKEHLNEFLAQQETSELEQAPYFELTVHRNFTRYYGKNQRVSTEVVGIKVDVDDTDVMENLLLKANLPSQLFGIFVPMTMSHSDPEVFLSYLRGHMRFLLKIRKIAIVGLFPEVTQTKNEMGISIEDRLLDLKNSAGEQLCQGLEFHWSTETKGIRFFLVADSEYDEAIKLIDEELPQWTEEMKASQEIDWTQFPPSLQHPRRTSQAIPAPQKVSQLQPLSAIFSSTTSDIDDSRPVKRSKNGRMIPVSVRTNAWNNGPPSTITHSSTTMDTALESIRKEYETQQQQLSARLEKYEKSMNEKLDERDQKLESNLADMKSQLDTQADTVQKIQQQQQDLANVMTNTIETKLHTVESNVSALSHQFGQMETSIAASMGSMSAMFQQLMKQQDEVKQMLTDQTNNSNHSKRLKPSPRLKAINLPMTSADVSDLQDSSFDMVVDTCQENLSTQSTDPHEVGPHGNLREP